ncbi:MAG TPA: hypothetical protein DEB40_07105 [Elusimicrobia bacterium]|nr:hypothetical protein [Elusimicrobiota bacterium]HBT61496.1 hypothetical protein [Elusimicrobiota bacterium]
MDHNKNALAVLAAAVLLPGLSMPAPAQIRRVQGPFKKTPISAAAGSATALCAGIQPISLKVSLSNGSLKISGVSAPNLDVPAKQSLAIQAPADMGMRGGPAMAQASADERGVSPVPELSLSAKALSLPAAVGDQGSLIENLVKYEPQLLALRGNQLGLEKAVEGMKALFDTARPEKSLDDNNGPESGAGEPQWLPISLARAAPRAERRPEAMPGVLAEEKLRAVIGAMRSSAKPVVTDLSLEAFLPELEGASQLALGVGGLGFLTGETWGAYGRLDSVHGIGVMPLYDQYVDVEGRASRIAWENEPGIRPVMVRGEDGREIPLQFEVEFKGGRENRVSVFWVDRGGTPVFLLHSPGMFQRLYPGGNEQLRQYAFFARAYVEFMKKLDIAPEIIRLNEPQLVFVANAVKNDVDFHGRRGKRSLFSDTRFAGTTHTPERAALPFWDVEWLKGEVGPELVRDEMIVYRQGGRVADAAIGMARMADIVNGVSEEHAKVTASILLPEFQEKIVGIQNGSDPERWYSDGVRNRVKRARSLDEISGDELFRIGRQQTLSFNEYLQDSFGVSFSNPDRPLVGGVRRLVQYKEQGMLIAMVEWIVGDREHEYETPLGRKKGLGANLLIGGLARDEVGAQWRREFLALMRRPDLKGRFLFIDGSGDELLRQATSASDIWFSIPDPTREASGTSDQRAAFNGKHNIASATGGPLAYLLHGVTGWLIDVFQDRPFIDTARRFDIKDPAAIAEYRAKGSMALTEYLEEALGRYYAYAERGEGSWADEMRLAFLISHFKVSIGTMIQKYGLLFQSILDGTGPAGFLKKLKRG